ncbi:MAG: hypothetical protein HY985_05240 [Magnetospirillum sp.]|nr:hypothetical protein [Magnetospirillum sp.]
MAGIGSLVNTPQGLGQVVTLVGGSQEVGGERFQSALVQTLSPSGDTASASASTAAPSIFAPSPASASHKSEDDLSASERQALAELQATDRAVKAEERQHAAVAGAYGSTPQYEYVQGPDGKWYAVGGHVQVSSAGAADAEDAAQVAGKLSAAAQSVMSPSSADFAAAVEFAQQAAKNAGLALRQAADRYAAQPWLRGDKGGVVSISG